jgi:tetratricopeptide (TPR) repeat protein
MTHRLLILLISLFVTGVYAQIGRDSLNRTGSVRVHVTLGEGRACDVQATVSLVSTFGPGVAQDFTNADCEVNFVNVAAGRYHLAVSGAGIESSDSGAFELASRGFMELNVNVNRVGEANHNGIIAPANPLVAVADLKIPEGARKELDKANQFAAKGNWQKSLERLKKAIAICPLYAEAYNNLGVVYDHLGDRVRNREALQKAVSLNDHLAPAYVNLARIAIVDRDFPQAEALLNKATAIDPTDPPTLVLLANVELLNKHYDQALAVCRRAHSTAKGEHALVHYVAARIFEHENRPADALAELQVFQSEEQPGPRAEAARKEMVDLQQRLAANEVAR